MSFPFLIILNLTNVLGVTQSEIRYIFTGTEFLKSIHTILALLSTHCARIVQ